MARALRLLTPIVLATALMAGCAPTEVTLAQEACSKIKLHPGNTPSDDFLLMDFYFSVIDDIEAEHGVRIIASVTRQMWTECPSRMALIFP